jgi:glutathione S-transferase
MDACEDLSTRIGNTISLPEDAKKKAREDLAAGHIKRYLEQLQARLQAAGGEYFADKRLTVADLKVFMLIRWLRAGVLDHIPKDVVERNAPLLVKHFERVSSNPKVAEYYQRRKAA